MWQGLRFSEWFSQQGIEELNIRHVLGYWLLLVHT